MAPVAPPVSTLMQCARDGIGVPRAWIGVRCCMCVCVCVCARVCVFEHNYSGGVTPIVCGSVGGSEAAKSRLSRRRKRATAAAAVAAAGGG